MLRIILVMAASLLIGCMGGEDAVGGGTRESIRPGLYEEKVNATYGGVFVATTGQTQFKSDGTYQMNIFLETFEFVQSKGRWTHGGNQIFYTQKLRRVANEDGTWGPWVVQPDEYEQVRNITETSFQYYFDFEKSFSAEEREQIGGMSSGWRTCNRIGE